MPIDCVFSGCSGMQEITLPFVGNKANMTTSDTYIYPFGYVFGEESYDGGVETEQLCLRKTGFDSDSSYTTTSSKYVIPSSLKKVNIMSGGVGGAFYNCTSLTSIVIGDGVTKIGSRAFYNCTSLESVVFGDSVTSIGDSAFRGCTSLTSITIPDSIASIGIGVFYECASLIQISYQGTIEQWNSIDKKTADNGARWNYGSSIKSIICTDGTITL